MSMRLAVKRSEQDVRNQAEREGGSAESNAVAGDPVARKKKNHSTARPAKANKSSKASPKAASGRRGKVGVANLSRRRKSNESTNEDNENESNSEDEESEESEEESGDESEESDEEPPLVSKAAAKKQRTAAGTAQVEDEDEDSDSEEEEDEDDDGYGSDLMGYGSERERLLALPEVERERILFERSEQRQEREEQVALRKRVQKKKRASAGGTGEGGDAAAARRSAQAAAVRAAARAAALDSDSDESDEPGAIVQDDDEDSDEPPLAPKQGKPAASVAVRDEDSESDDGAVKAESGEEEEEDDEEEYEEDDDEAPVRGGPKSKARKKSAVREESEESDSSDGEQESRRAVAASAAARRALSDSDDEVAPKPATADRRERNARRDGDMSSDDSDYSYGGRHGQKPDYDLRDRTRDRSSASPPRRKRSRSHSRDRDRRRARRDSSRSRSKSPSSRRGGRDKDYDGRRDIQEPEPEPSLEDINRCRVPRDYLERWSNEPYFDKAVIGCFVRVARGVDDGGERLYAMSEIVSVAPYKRRYKIGKSYTSKCLRISSSTAQVRDQCMDIVSNSRISEEEYRRWKDGRKAARAPVLTVAECSARRSRMNKIVTGHQYTAEEVSRMVKQREDEGVAYKNIALNRDKLSNLLEAALAEGHQDDADILREKLAKLDEREAILKKRLDMGAAGMRKLNQRNQKHNIHTDTHVGRKKRLEEQKRREDQAAGNEGGDFDPFKRRPCRPKNLWSVGGNSPTRDGASMGGAASNVSGGGALGGGDDEDEDFPPVATKRLKVNGDRTSPSPPPLDPLGLQKMHSFGGVDVLEAGKAALERKMGTTKQKEVRQATGKLTLKKYLEKARVDA